MPPCGSPRGSPIRFRFKHRAALRQIVGEVGAGGWTRKPPRPMSPAWVEKNAIPEAEREKFRDMAEAELVSLHEETSHVIRSGQANSRHGSGSDRKQEVMSDGQPQGARGPTGFQ